MATTDNQTDAVPQDGGATSQSATTDNQTEAVPQDGAATEQTVPQERPEEKDNEEEGPTTEELARQHDVEQKRQRDIIEQFKKYNRATKERLHGEKLERVNVYFIGIPGVGKSTTINRCCTAMDESNMYDSKDEFALFSLSMDAPMASGNQHCTQGMTPYGVDHYSGDELGNNFTIVDNKGMDQDFDKESNKERLKNFFKSLTDGYVIDNETLKSALTHDTADDRISWAEKQRDDGKRQSEEERPHVLVFVATASSDLDDQWELLNIFKKWRNFQHAPFVPYHVALAGADKCDETLRKTPWMYLESHDLKEFKNNLKNDHGVDRRLVFPIVNDVIFEEADVHPTDPRLVALDNMTLRLMSSAHKEGTKHRGRLLKKKLKEERKRERQMQQTYAASSVTASYAPSRWGDDGHDDGLPPFPGRRIGEQQHPLNRDSRDGRYTDLHDRRPGSQRASSPPRTEGGRKETRGRTDVKANPQKTGSEDQTRDFIAEQS